MVTNGTNPPTSAKSEPQMPDQPVMVEDYAERLIDELFTDVERVLEGGAKLPSEPVQPEFVSLKSIQVPQIVLPTMTGVDASDQAIDPEVVRDATPHSSNPSFDRLLMGAAFSSLVITLGLWVATRGGLNRLFAPAPVAVAPETSVSPRNQADVQFANYVGRSLGAIKKKADAMPALPMVPPVMAPTSTLPALPVPGNTAALPNAAAETNNLIQSINRVAQAVEAASRETAMLSNRVMGALNNQLQQQQQATTTTPTPGGQTSGSYSIVQQDSSSTAQPQVAETASPPESTTTASTTTTTTTTTTAAAEPDPIEQTPVAAAPIPQAIPAPEPIPTVAATIASPASPETQTAAASSSSDPASIHTLVGILELGDRSAALFEVNGVARRIYIGENIAGSGWTLVEVANQEAVMRRNGEVRTIFVGQQF